MIHKIKIKDGIRLAYVIAFVLGLVLLPMAIYAAYVQRGYWGVGGEFLVPLFFVIIIFVINMAKEEIRGDY